MTIAFPKNKHFFDQSKKSLSNDKHKIKTHYDRPIPKIGKHERSNHELNILYLLGVYNMLTLSD